MAEPYLSDLRELVGEWLAAASELGALECRHFFSGAAAYRDGAIVASLTPVGLGFKVQRKVHDDLLARGLAGPLRYFPKAPIKRGYVLFQPGSEPSAGDAVRLIFGQNIDQGGAAANETRQPR